MDPLEAYAAYSHAWEPGSPDERIALLERGWAQDGVFVVEDEPEDLVGREALLAYIAGSHEQMPGLSISETSAPKMLGGRMLVRWVATETSAEQTFVGTDVIEFAEDGRIARLTMFYDD